MELGGGLLANRGDGWPWVRATVGELNRYVGLYPISCWGFTHYSYAHVRTTASWMLLDWGGGDGLVGLTLTVPPV